ncbi:hypothetical protein BGW38_008204 [Lunasporangiospora selenospora]|uniref:Protein kinase domain-containing protein n=1 Tax=Lunasporangiospora selenospora TaxID=979761 RepID=A0A9P6FYC9_9FUNG|nr:hypothetical protein BGW38_008204 [Lunasporangiospora selenospora]
MAAVSISSIPLASSASILYNPEPLVKSDLISSALLSAASTSTSSSVNHPSSLRKTVLQQRQFSMGAPAQPSHRLSQPRHQHQQHQHPLLHQIHQTTAYKKTTPSSLLASKLRDIMSNPLLIAPLRTMSNSTSQLGMRTGTEEEEEMPSSPNQDYVYTAPCEHHPSKGRTDYLVNDMFPKLTHDLSTIEFGIRIADFMPLAFKTVPVAGLAEKELQLLDCLRDLPNVIHLEDSFVNDNGDTVLVLPMLKKFDCQVVNKSLCSVRKTIRQILTGLAAVHAKNIVHLDINPSNLMVTHTEKDVVIIDFGLSMTVNRNVNHSSVSQVPACGTTGYIAPEVLNARAFDPADPTLADIYSLGIVLGQMLEPYIPDCDLHYFGSKYLSVENTQQTVMLLNEFVAQGAYYPKVLVQAADLLRCMLASDPKDRKSAQELLDTHLFLTTCTEVMVATAAAAAAAVAAGTTLFLCDWLYRVQEIKYQKYLYQDKSGCEIYRNKS